RSVTDKLSKPPRPSHNQILQGTWKGSGVMAHDSWQRTIRNLQPKTPQSPGSDRRTRPRSPFTLAERVHRNRRERPDWWIGIDGKILRHDARQFRQDDSLVKAWRSCLED